MNIDHGHLRNSPMNSAKIDDCFTVVPEYDSPKKQTMSRSDTKKRESHRQDIIEMFYEDFGRFRCSSRVEPDLCPLSHALAGPPVATRFASRTPKR